MHRFGYKQRRLAAVLAAAALLSGSLIAASELDARSEEPAASAEPAPAAAPAVSQFAGIAQSGNALGDPDAPVTLVEYADLQCPYCAEWAERTLPVLVADYVRSGRLRIVFNGLAFLGPESQVALHTAIAAGRHHRLWNVVDGLYVNQGPENGGWVNDGLLDRLAEESGLSGAALRAESAQPWVAREAARSARAARAAGITGTPSFQIGRTNGPLQTVTVSSLDPQGIRPAIEAVLAR